jgi:hypothetical protein
VFFCALQNKDYFLEAAMLTHLIAALCIGYCGRCGYRFRLWTSSALNCRKTYVKEEEDTISFSTKRSPTSTSHALDAIAATTNNLCSNIKITKAKLCWSAIDINK